MKWHQRFFWLLLLFLPTQLGFHFWPDWAGVLGRRIDYLSPTLYFTDILIVITIITWFLSSRDPAGWRGDAISHFMRLLRFARNDKGRKAGCVIITTLLFITINVFFAVNRPVAVYKWIKVMEFVLLGWYIVRTKPKLSSLSFPLAAGVFYSSVLAIAQFMLQHSIGGPLWWLGERTFTVDTPGIARTALNWSLGFGHWDFGLKLRPYATFPHPNVLGGYIAAILPLIIISREAGSRSARQFSIFKITTIIVGVVALLLTFSRSAIVVGILALVLVFFQKKKILFFLAILFLTFSFFLFPFSFFEESVVVRQQLNVAAIKLWQSSPLFGVGLGNFLVRLPEALPSRTIYFLQPVHNIYLFVLAETGVVGLAFFLWIIAKSFQKTFSTCPPSLRSGAGRRVWHLSFGILLVLGLLDHYPLTLQQGQLLLTVLAARAVLSVH